MPTCGVAISKYQALPDRFGDWSVAGKADRHELLAFERPLVPKQYKKPKLPPREPRTSEPIWCPTRRPGSGRYASACDALVTHSEAHS